MSLPRFMILASDASGKYLSCHGKAKGSSARASLNFSEKIEQPNLDLDGDSISIELLKKKEEKKEEETQFHLFKFEVEEAKSAPGLVHIRTCYNHKYWVRESEESKRIVAEANEPEEDETKWNCTLFKPIFLGEIADGESALFDISKHGVGKAPQKIQLMHASEAKGKQYYVASELEELQLSEQAVTFNIIDVEVMAILPKYFTLMGHDGTYLGTPDGTGLWFRFTDMATKGVAMTSIEVGSWYPELVYFQPKGFLGYWSVNSNTTIGLTPHDIALFFPVKVDNYVAIYFVRGMFVTRTGSGNNSHIRANSSNITEETRLRVGEPVVSRTILSAEYKLEDARTYGMSILNKYEDSRSNYSSVEQTGTFQVSYTRSSTTSWSQSLTVSVGISTSWSFGVPLVGDGGIEISYGREETWEWGEEKTEEHTISYTQSIAIPPMTKITLKVMSYRAQCDVPFHCVVRDLMTDGTRRDYTKTDGLFSGANEYGFHTIIQEEKL